LFIDNNSYQFSLQIQPYKIEFPTTHPALSAGFFVLRYFIF
jgi:hypothetical protein